MVGRLVKNFQLPDRLQTKKIVCVCIKLIQVETELQLKSVTYV
jgi:hypothetical protein